MLTARDQNHNYLYLKRQSPSWQIISVGDERHERPEQRMACRWENKKKSVWAAPAVVGGVGTAGCKERRKGEAGKE